MNPLRSLSFRLALTYVGLFTMSVLILIGTYYWLTISRPYEAVRTQIAGEASTLADEYILHGDVALSRALAARNRRPSTRKAYQVFIDKAGRIVTANLPSWPPSAASGWLRLEADVFHEGIEQDAAALLLIRTFDDGARLMVGRDVVDLEEREEVLRSAGAYIVGIVVLLGSLGGLLMSRAIGQRIDVVTETARRVIAGDLSGRIALRGSGDDFDRLGATLNAMLARIEALFESVRQVSDSIAHELRTPLTRLQADLEELASALPEDRQRLVEQAVDEAARLQSVFDALLRIARIESGRHAFSPVDVDLSSLLADAAEFYRPEADSRSITLVTAIAEGLRLRGDPDLLFQAVLNLLDNAIKFSRLGGEVALRAEALPGRAELVVTDTGPGISAEHRERVSERFYRVPETNPVAGAGLGLSLVAAVAELQLSSIVFEDNAPGLRVRWSIPNDLSRPAPGRDRAGCGAARRRPR